MSDKIVQLNEAAIKNELKKLVRGSVEETFDELLKAGSEKLAQAARYERNERRQGYRSGHWSSSRLWRFWTLYAAIGINNDGRKDVLKMWGCENYSFSAVTGTTNTPSGRW